ncbi:MAG: acetyl-CoA C-acetyltransferase [Planctomycetes bacterium]|nr:acetyl-CoA C-acetyltransferase [Planctomycetota bacterium]
MKDVVIVSAVRTGLGKFNGMLTKFDPIQLGTMVAKEAIKRAGINPDVVEETIFGHVLQGSWGQNPARQVAHHAGIPDSTGSFTVNKVCGSGLKAVMIGAMTIMLGDHDCILCGGMESMTNAPYFSREFRFGNKMSVDINRGPALVDLMVNDGLWDKYENYHMGNTGEVVAEKYGVTREMQDEYAYNSHRKAAEAQKEGRFAEEIMPVEVPQRKADPIVFKHDEGVIAEPSIEKMAKLRSVFKKDGTVTAGNASQISDGAAAVILMSAEKAQALGLKPMAKITGYATGGVEPKMVMIAPVEAMKNLEKKTGMSRHDFDLIELNEAFSSAAVAVSNELGLDPNKVNVNGGAVAMGHPIGCSGTRVLVTLMHALKQRNLKKGAAMLCLGGGNAVITSIEML